MKTMNIPQTDSIEELAHFWDEHDLTDFEDELEEVTEPVFARGKKATVQIQLSWQELERLKRLARDRGVGYDVLAQQWIAERLIAA